MKSTLDEEIEELEDKCAQRAYCVVHATNHAYAVSISGMVIGMILAFFTPVWGVGVLMLLLAGLWAAYQFYLARRAGGILASMKKRLEMLKRTKQREADLEIDEDWRVL